MTGSILALAAAGLTLAASTVRATDNFDTTYDRWAPIVSNITWADCEGSDGGVGYQCGYLDVPMDYANSSAGKASLALARYPAQVTPRLGTIFVNPGGPGGAGTDLVLEMGVTLSNSSGGQYDILAWDPRGVGYTFPVVSCFNSTEEEATFWQGTVPENGIEVKGNFTNADSSDPDVIAFWAQEPRVDTLLGSVGDRCLQDNGDILTYVGTAAAVRDIMAISDVIDGAGSLVHYWGFSYGTVIGNYLVNMFPDRVGRVIIDGVVKTDLYASGPPYLIWSYQIQDTEDVLAGFTSSCAAAGPTGCPIANSGSTSDSIRNWILALSDAAYDYLQAGGQYGSAYIRGLIFEAMYHPTQWPDLANNLYQIADMLYNGNNTNANNKRTPMIGYDLPEPSHNWGIPRRAVRRSTPFKDAMIKRGILKRAEVDPPLYDYAFQAITCADAVDAGNTTTTDVFNEIVYAALNVSAVFGPAFSIGGFYCHKWPARAVERFSGPWTSTPKNPIIVIGNQADPITPLPGAKWVASTLGDGTNAYLVEQDDYGHSSLAEHSDCTVAIVTAFFNNGTLPTDDQTCPTNQVLFPSASITKQSLDAGIIDPALDPKITVPGSKHGPSNLADAGTPADGGSTTTVTATITATVTPTSSASTADQNEINSLKDTRRMLLIALGALSVAFIGAILAVVLASRRGKSSSYSSGSSSGGGFFSKRKSSKGIRVNLIEPEDDHDLDNDGRSLMKQSGGAGLVATGYANDSPRASMETVKGYSGGGGYTDPYDPPASALGSTSLNPTTTKPAGSSRPSSPGYRYADGGAEYRD